MGGGKVLEELGTVGSYGAGGRGRLAFSFPDGLNKPDGLGVDNRHPAGLATGIRHLLGHVLIHMLDSRRLRPWLSAYVFELISFPLTQQPVVS